MRNAALVLLVSLCGCATTPEPQVVWRKPGSGQSEFDVDHANCRVQALSATGPLAPGDPMLIHKAAHYASIRNACLQGRGWTPGQ